LQQFIKLLIDLISLASPATTTAAASTTTPSPTTSDKSAKSNKSTSLAANTEDGADCWPPTRDAFIEYMLDAYQQKHAGSHLGNYVAVLWVLYLRSVCGLRGIKPFELFYKNELNADLLQQISGDIIGKMMNNNDGSGSNTSSPSGNTGSIIIGNTAIASSLLETRYEFILQCFRRCVDATSIHAESTLIIYKLAGPQGWRMELNLVRLAHITALLDHGGIDEQAEEIIAQVR
jgi:hypothetical protein